MDVPHPTARPGGTVGQTRICRKVLGDLPQDPRKQFAIALRIEVAGGVGAQTEHER
jgi:hypothetical protein